MEDPDETANKSRHKKMIQGSRFKIQSLPIMISLFFVLLIYGHVAMAGPYLDSAHGNYTPSPGYGVNRTATANSGYARGNCAHCHEQHASIGGSEPAPASGSASPFALFADNFDNKIIGPYVQTDNFCFYCHVNVGAVQTEGSITNKQYSNTFGGYTIDSATDIMGAFSLNSYHNLYDIQDFAKTKFDFFKDSSNPCVACHNPHRAKRNKAHPTDPSYTAISRPTDHENLWGDDANERMSNYTYYRPPYYYGSNATYEPDGSALHDGSLIPDYNAFCLDCHQYQVPTSQSASMNPNTPATYLTAINWSASGDMHGERSRIYDVNGTGNSRTGTIIAPYNVVPVQSNYVLSCLDCHEPHGSVLVSGRPSSYLLRKKVNNNRVDGCGPGFDERAFCETDFCGSCHTFSHCGGPQGCFQCHYHGAYGNGPGWCGSWVGPVF